MLSTLFIMNLVAAAAVFGPCAPELLPELPLFRSALVHKGFLTEAEAWTAELRWVVINYESSGPLRRLTRLNRTKEAKGLIMVDSRARPLVFLKTEDPRLEYRIFYAADHPEATVWEGETRILRAVQGEWQWEDTPPPRREVSDLTLTQFLGEFETVLRPMLDSGEITEADIIGGVIQTSVHNDRYIILSTPEKMFVFSRDKSPTWDKTFISGLTRKRYIEVGPSRRRLYQRYTPDNTPTGQFGWAPPLGVADHLLRRVADPTWRAFIKEEPTEVDALLLHPLKPELGRLDGARMMMGRVGEDDAHVLLIPKFGGGEAIERPFPYRVNTWIWPGDLSLSEVIELSDGRRLGVTPDRTEFRWLPRADAFIRLRAAAQTRSGRR